MKKISRFLSALVIVGMQSPVGGGRAFAASIAAASASAGSSGGGGITIKKAGAVKEQPQEKMDAFTGTNLAGMAIGLVAAVQSMKKEERGMNESCKPSTEQVNFVNKMMKEYAKIGQNPADKTKEAVGAPASGNCGTYENYVLSGMGGEICYDVFKDPTDDENRIWAQYPKAAQAVRACPKNKPGCAEPDKKYYSNAYEIYAQMGWTEADLLPDELSQHAAVMRKVEDCSAESLNRKQKEMAGNVITGAIGTLGKKQNTAATMQTAMGVVAGMDAPTGLGGGLLQMAPGIITALPGMQQ